MPVIRGRQLLATSVPFGWIDSPPAVNRLMGLRGLAWVLYPQVFTKDLRPMVHDFYNRFCHQTPTDAQLNQLLTAPQDAQCSGGCH